MKRIPPDELAKLEQRLKGEISYRRASTAHHGGDSDPHKATHIMTSQRVLDALREASGSQKAEMFWCGLPVNLDFLLRGPTYRIEPTER